MLEQRYQFIPLDKYAIGVVPEELAERFIAAIIGAVAPWLRLLGFFTDVQLNFELLGVAVGFLHSCLFKRHLDLLLQLVLIDVRLVRQHGDFIFLRSFDFEPVHEPQRFIHCRRLQRSWPADKARKRAEPASPIAWLPKPYTMPALVAVVRSAVAQPHPG